MKNNLSEDMNNLAKAFAKLGASIEGTTQALAKFGWIIEPPKKRWWEFWK